ncbi:uncharacterized protein LOC105386639 isoform X2 [Plutella xylostella]|uniref:uncharacterized protein LOC105386639 isoform X2 n=1 Tax=Plutella xylostella TaxID=51655 RepID=UPI0020324A80|nr:uncharacterized protein LOC105386639 isoform X2 [Plutella xylostella]
MRVTSGRAVWTQCKCKMFGSRSVVVSFLLAFASCAAGGGEGFEECMGIFSAEAHVFECCESLNQRTSFDLIKCKNETDECTKAECLLKKMQIKLTDGRIDDASATTFLDKWVKELPGNRDMGERVKKQCLEGQYEDYAAEETACEPFKFALCAYVNSVVVCPKWKQSDRCKQMEESAAKCKKILDEIE